MFRNSKNSFGLLVPESRFRIGAGPNVAGCILETLERRRLLSGGSVTLDANGILTIVGTEQTDHIDVYRDRTNGDYLNLCTYTSLNAMDVGRPVRIADVRGIVIYGLGGDDLIYVWNDRFSQNDHVNPASLSEYGKLNIPVTMYGGAGDDDLGSESNADDLIIGGPGFDHGYTMDGHDRFAVDYLENYHDSGERTDPDTGATYWDWGGAFKWNGSEDEIYADPYQVPNRGGTYLGSNAPTFPSEDSGHYRHHRNLDDVSPVAPDLENVDPVEFDAKGGGGASNSPATKMTTVIPPPPTASPFSVSPVGREVDGRKLWDDAISG